MMTLSNTTYFFECAQTLEWFRCARPASTCLLIKDLIVERTPPKEALHRLALVETALASEHKSQASDYLYTLERLRETFILLPEHVEHCFEQLPASPKNKRLKQLFQYYFDSPLVDDWVAAAWRYIGQLKSACEPTFGSVVFIKSIQPSLIFLEIANAFRYVSPDVQIVDAAEIEPTTPMPQPLHTGNLSERLSYTAQLARSALDSGAQRVLIPFCGEPQLSLTLKAFLAAHGIRAHVMNYPSMPSKPSWVHTVHQSPFALMERLNLIRLYWSNPERENPSFDWKSYWKTCHDEKRLTSEQHDWMQSADKQPPTHRNASGEDPQAIIGPFLLLPRTEQTSIIAFLGDTPFETFDSHLLLDDLECFKLIQQGFPLPAFSDFRSRILTQCRLAQTLVGPRQLADLIARDSVLHRPHYPTVCPPTEPKIPFKRGALSATALENYAKCPALYLFANGLRISPTTESDSFALILGSLTHKTLETFFQSGTKDTADLLPQFLWHLQNDYPSIIKSPSIGTRLTTHFTELARSVPTIEAALARLYNAPTPVAHELSFETTIDGISVRGRIDRVDKTQDGLTVLIDYKTAMVDFSPNHIASGKNFQALLYLLATATTLHPVAGFLFYDLRKGEIRRGLLRRSLIARDSVSAVTRGHALPDDKFEALLTQGKEHLKQVASRIDSSDFDPAPSAAQCQHCFFPPHCRMAYGTDT